MQVRRSPPNVIHDRDDYVATMQQALDSVQNFVWRLDDLIIEKQLAA